MSRENYINKSLILTAKPVALCVAVLSGVHEENATHGMLLVPVSVFCLYFCIKMILIYSIWDFFFSFFFFLGQIYVMTAKS